MEQFLPIREIAAKLSCSEQTIRRLVKSGKITAIQMGKDYRISEKALLLSLHVTDQKCTNLIKR